MIIGEVYDGEVFIDFTKAYEEILCRYRPYPVMLPGDVAIWKSVPLPDNAICYVARGFIICTSADFSIVDLGDGDWDGGQPAWPRGSPVSTDKTLIDLVKTTPDGAPMVPRRTGLYLFVDVVLLEKFSRVAVALQEVDDAIERRDEQRCQDIVALH